ncbi:hypothetical protein [Natrinema sp. 1APR25-10V2]|uniref:hypothetical protein n=1 Tax=Natrinema sp. 1APR25-10V2 TaxID=2951081 RepID=UPI002874683B|nr:hypothetical protein [Natrinema sp. 1APR25-10V2]MDS0476805.1 hypothetical protein [Natrinema sp. 1APR25-10V2]
MSVLKVKAGTYEDPVRSWSYAFCGLPEEVEHFRHASSGHVRTMAWLEHDSREAFRALINEREDISTAKERIVHNERACEAIYRNCADLMEARDQYLVQTIFDCFDPGPETPLVKQWMAFGRNIIQHEFMGRDPVSTTLDAKLHQLAARYGTPLVPLYAAFLALNIPLPDMEAAAATRAERIAAIDFEDRFEEVFNTLIDDTEAVSLTVTDADMTWDDGLHHYVMTDAYRQRFFTLFNDCIQELAIDTALGCRNSVSLPLLDAPARRTPSLYTRYENLIHDDRFLSQPFVTQEILCDAALAYGHCGCVILCTEYTQPLCYLPNPYLSTTLIGGRRYFHVFCDTFAAQNMLNQAIGQSVNGIRTPLHCPFCSERHDPRQGNCAWDAVLKRHTKNMAGAADWEDYFGKTAAVVDDFVATDVPGEDHLAASRARRRTG